MFSKQLSPSSFFKLIIKLVGFICYLVHMYFIFYNQVYPSETFTRMVEKRLDDIEFPVIFKLCVTPALNVTELKSAGYRNIWRYFLGQSAYNTSLYGWGGHSSLGTPRHTVRGNQLLGIQGIVKIKWGVKSKLTDTCPVSRCSSLM